MPYSGSCHCGAVTFDVAADAPEQAITCNCSYCRRTGQMLAFVPRAALTATGEGALTEYRFGAHRIAHLFCSTCGAHPFGHGTAPDGSETAAINLRCVPAIDVDALSVHQYDGASL